MISHREGMPRRVSCQDRTRER